MKIHFVNRVEEGEAEGIKVLDIYRLESEGESEGVEEIE
jgi:hypothetical protein